MKRIITIILLCAAAFSASAQGEVAKTGLNFGPLPAIGYSSDLGWHYGALSDIYWYGDGSTYPEYVWKANVEISKYSKGNTVLHSFFDSKYLVPGIRISGAISWFGNKTTSFYGFNGANSVYVPALDRITADSKDFGYFPEGQGFYLMRRDIFRIQTCLQGEIGGNWGWAGGITYWNIKTGHAENKGLSGDIFDVSLYDLYVKNGIIPEAEKNGGQHLEFKAGVVYDTRDHENNPTRGTNLEVYMFGSPDIISKHNNSYLKLAVHFKQFFPVIQDKLTFGAHLAFQGLIAGNAPYYMLQTIQSINMKQINTEGLGSTCTLRGTINNRLQGNSYAWANTEFRWSFAKFRWINQNWTLATNPFFDMGMIVKPYNADAMKKLATDISSVSIVTDKGNNTTTNYLAKDFYNDVEQKLHFSAGIGLHVIMNQNFNINFEFGKCLDPNDGTGLGINIGLNYIF
ncbi:MAG: BamA/TamA family outer membrane protein [Bacteroidales bacterium]|nr:BamA/TamA family outer membrane protein [Bacteroidales bacterium]